MRTEPEYALKIRDHFLGWQCRVRQIAMRQDGGRPSPGMRPRVLTAAGHEITRGLTMLLIPTAPEESTAFFRFQVQRSNDPREIYERGLAFLRSDHFQRPKDFSERLTAALPSGSAVAATLLAHPACVLEFDEFRQSYRLPCAVLDLPTADPAREATLWHNRIFSPALPDDTTVLSFRPDWTNATADPPPTT